MPRRLILAIVPVAAAAGLVSLCLGILLTTALAPPSQTTGQVPAVGGVPVVDTANGVLDLDGPRVEVRATSASGGPAFIGIARADDVTAYLAGTSHSEITRVADDGTLTIQRIGSAAGLPNPAGADIWVMSDAGTGTVSLTWPDTPGSWRVVIAGDGSSEAPGQISLTWARAPRPSPAPALIGVGALLLIGGLVGLVVLRGRRRGDDADGDPSPGSAPEPLEASEASETPRDVPVSTGPAHSGARAGVDRRRRRRRRGSGLAIVLVGAVMVLSGCSGGSGGASAQPDPAGPHPVVLAAQGRMILDKVSRGVASSAEAESESGIGSRVVGPQREILTASLELPARVRPAGPVTDPSWQRLIVLAQRGWPRWYAAIGRAPSRQTPVIWVLISAKARTPYGLWGELEMLPGARFPEVAPVSRGASDLPPDTLGLVATPRDVAGWYADLLGTGSSSRYATAFAPDAFGEQVMRRVAGDRAKLLAVRGAVTSRQAVRGDPLALRTTDGGALVIVALTETSTIQLPAAGGEVRFEDPVVTSLAGRSVFTSRVVQTSIELVAFNVPPASAGEKIHVVAAAKSRLTVTGW